MSIAITKDFIRSRGGRIHLITTGASIYAGKTLHKCTRLAAMAGHGMAEQGKAWQGKLGNYCLIPVLEMGPSCQICPGFRESNNS